MFLKKTSYGQNVSLPEVICSGEKTILKEKIQNLKAAKQPALQ